MKHYTKEDIETCMSIYRKPTITELIIAGLMAVCGPCILFWMTY